MVKNDVSFILSFVILMAKMWIFGFSPVVCPTEPSNLVFSLGCLVSNGRRALLGGIRLGGSATMRMRAQGGQWWILLFRGCPELTLTGRWLEEANPMVLALILN